MLKDFIDEIKSLDLINSAVNVRLLDRVVEEYGNVDQLSDETKIHIMDLLSLICEDEGHTFDPARGGIHTNTSWASHAIARVFTDSDGVVKLSTSILSPNNPDKRELVVGTVLLTDAQYDILSEMGEFSLVEKFNPLFNDETVISAVDAAMSTFDPTERLTEDE